MSIGLPLPQRQSLLLSNKKASYLLKHGVSRDKNGQRTV